MLEPLAPDESTWLSTHLDGCAECRLEHEAYLADRMLLRALRDNPPDPPRDLWARTSAAIEREAARGRSGLPLADRLVPRQVRLPLGILSGALVVLVVVATSVLPQDNGIAQATHPAGSDVAVVTPPVEPSPLAVNPAKVAWVQTNADGSIDIITADIDEVCPSEKTGCAPLQQTGGTVLKLGAAPDALVGSPNNNQIVVVSGSKGSGAGSIIVVPVATPTVQPTTPAGSQTPTIAPTAPPATPEATPTGSQAPTPVPTPEGAHSIAEGVIVVGETRYSADGKWLAFSARPIDGSTGPDLYVWNGTDPSARQVTTDHATYFSSWLGDTILASRVKDFRRGPATPLGSSSPEATDGTGPQTEVHPASFVFDPATDVSTDLALPDVWLPTVDPTGRFMTYWSGTLLAGPGHSDKLQLGTGRLVLDGWLAPLGAPLASAAPAGSETPAGSAGTSPVIVGPAGTPIELVQGPITAFDLQFDPTGTRLAVWVADAGNPNVGTLRLVVLDPALGAINDHLTPLQSERALKGVSIAEGRLAWVSPPGENGNQSSVRVLAWLHDDFGQVQTLPGEQLAIIR
jgi:hypothetical protein